MAEHQIQLQALEHRCQCCGELTTTVFCSDCESHTDS